MTGASLNARRVARRWLLVMGPLAIATTDHIDFRAGLARYKMISLSDDEQELELPAATETPESQLLAMNDREAVRQAARFSCRPNLP